MNESPDHLLDAIEPPPGGWERLRARREAKDLRRAPWLAFAVGLGVAAIGMFVTDRKPATQLTLPASGAWLQGKPVADEPLRLLTAGTASPLPAVDGVRLYWTEPAEP